MIDNVSLEFGISDISRINETIQEVDRQLRGSNEELIYCNKRQEDILHEIEFKKLSRKELGKLAAELRDIRVRRRKAKNMLELLQPMEQWISSNRAAVIKLSPVLGSMRKIREKQEGRCYISRADNGGDVIEHVD